MDAQYPKPQWWKLYATLAFLGTLMVGETGISLPILEHKLIQIAIVLIIFAVLCLWLFANAVALEYQELGSERTKLMRARWHPGK